jgi:hypothetical protein
MGVCDFLCWTDDEAKLAYFCVSFRLSFVSPCHVAMVSLTEGGVCLCWISQRKKENQQQPTNKKEKRLQMITQSKHSYFDSHTHYEMALAAVSASILSSCVCRWFVLSARHYYCVIIIVCCFFLFSWVWTGAPFTHQHRQATTTQVERQITIK